MERADGRRWGGVGGRVVGAGQAGVVPQPEGRPDRRPSPREFVVEGGWPFGLVHGPVPVRVAAVVARRLAAALEGPPGSPAVPVRAFAARAGLSHEGVRRALGGAGVPDTVTVAALSAAAGHWLGPDSRDLDRMLAAADAVAQVREYLGADDEGSFAEVLRRERADLVDVGRATGWGLAPADGDVSDVRRALRADGGMSTAGVLFVGWPARALLDELPPGTAWLAVQDGDVRGKPPP